MTGIPGTGDPDGGNAARAEQHVQRPGDPGWAGAARCREPQAGQLARINHIEVQVHIQRAAGVIIGGARPRFSRLTADPASTLRMGAIRSGGKAARGGGADVLAPSPYCHANPDRRDTPRIS